MKIENAVALVTGANRGIGTSLVNALIHAGAKKVYALSRQATLPTFESGKTEVLHVQADISDQDAIKKAATQASDINLLINNAGVLHMGNILELDLKDIEQDFKTNFYGTLCVSKHFAPIIKQNGGGAIVNILTLLSLASMPGFAAYNASKAAEWSLTQSLRANLASSNIKVHGVFPGAVDTDMLAGIEISKTAPASVASAILDGIINDQEDIFPDPMSAQVYAAWREDHKTVEKQFAQM